MKQRWTRFLVALGVVLLAAGALQAEEDKPLAPGWLSLDSSVGVLDAKIAEGKGALEKALGITTGGFLDTSYIWSSNHPTRPGFISGRYFDKDYNDIDFNYFHIFVEKPEKDWGVGFRLSGDFGRGGELLREATLWGKRLHKEPSAELRESYLTTTIPLGEGIGVKGGLFVTPMGTEILPNPGAYNDNISRSFLFNYGIPLRHLGILLNYPILKTLSVSGGAVTGWDDPRDNNRQPSGLWGFSFTPTEKISLVSNYIYGPEQFHNNSNMRFTMSHVATIKPIDPLTLIGEFTYGHEQKASLGGTRGATWYGFSGIASYNWTERFTTALRSEFFSDRDGARLGGDFKGKHADQTLGEVTLTGSYRFTKMFLGRVEFRQDWADSGFYKKGANRGDANQTTLAGQIIYTF